MAQIVTIAAGAYDPGFNKVGDILSIHDDDVELNSRGYDNFKIIRIKGLTAAEVRAKIKTNEVDVATAFKKNNGEWTLEEEDDYIEDRQVWKNPTDSKWYFLEKKRAIPAMTRTAQR